MNEKREPQGVYVHIPFCRAKCGYCDFNSYAGMDACMTPYTEAVCREAEHFGGAADTVYFGGGTPTLLPLRETERLLNAVRKRFSLAQNAEITLEANPATFDRERAAAYRAMGFNRMSIGVQSFHDTLLRRLGRLHNAAEAVRAAENAAEAGFDNLSIDLMYALPGQTVEQFCADLRRVRDLPLTHVSVYGLKVEEGTPLARQNVTVSEDDYAAMYEALCRILPDMGFAQYEISNFAKPGMESRHNLKYWHRVPYAGLGAGAHAFDGARRWENVRDVGAYIAAENPCAAEEILSERDVLTEQLIMGMRLTEGVEEALLRAFPNGAEKTARYEQMGLLYRPRAGQIAFTTRGFLVSNTVLASFLPD